MILFETSTSVFELLWDIALTLFILRISLTYFLLTFLSSLFISYFHTLTLSPLSLTSPPSLLYFLFNVGSITLWARWIIVVYEVPRVRGFRVAIGIVAVGYVVLVEAVVGVVGWEMGGMEWVWRAGLEEGWKVGVEGVGVLVVMLAMPGLLMVFEGVTDELGEVRTRHGHEGKGIVDAVPTVAINGKDKTANGKKLD